MVTKQKVGKRLYIAAEFLIRTLSKGERLSVDVYRLCEESGTKVATLKRAMRIVKVNSRKSGHNWFMSLTEGAKERFDCLTCSQMIALPKEPRYGCPAVGEISTDWTLVTVESGAAAKIAIPEYKGAKPSLRMKVGAYEFAADEDFPADKLSALLLALGGEISC